MKRSVIKNKVIVDEVKKIYNDNGGILRPLDVVEAARPKASPLHSQFEWNNTVAAEKFRLHQARMFINMLVDVIYEDKQEVRCFVSLKKDRFGEDTGYRTMVDVLSNKDLYASMLKDALEEMEYFRNKYYEIKELKEVFDAIERVKTKQITKK
jgi:hypothetical protein